MASLIAVSYTHLRAHETKVREAITKKYGQTWGKSPNMEGGRSTPLNPIPNLLTVFQKYLEWSEMQNKHIKYF